MCVCVKSRESRGGSGFILFFSFFLFFFGFLESSLKTLACRLIKREAIVLLSHLLGSIELAYQQQQKQQQQQGNQSCVFTQRFFFSPIDLSQNLILKLEILEGERTRVRTEKNHKEEEKDNWKQSKENKKNHKNCEDDEDDG